MKTNNGKRLMAAVIAFVMVACAVAVIASPVNAADARTPTEANTGLDYGESIDMNQDAWDALKTDKTVDGATTSYDSTNKVVKLLANQTWNLTGNVTDADVTLDLNGHNLKITGKYTLSLTNNAADDNGGYIAALTNENETKANIMIDGSTVTLIGNGTRAGGVWAVDAANLNQTYLVNGATLNVSKTSASIATGTVWCGDLGTPVMFVDGSTVNFSNAHENGAGVSKTAIYAYNNSTIDSTGLKGGSLSIYADLEDSTINGNVVGLYAATMSGDSEITADTLGVYSGTVDAAFTGFTTKSVDIGSGSEIKATTIINSLTAGTAAGREEISISGNGAISGNFTEIVDSTSNYNLNGVTVSGGAAAGASITVGENGISFGNFTAAQKSEIKAGTGEMRALAGSTVNLSDATVTGDSGWKLLVGAGASVKLPTVTYEPVISAADVDNADVTINGTPEEIKDTITFTTVTSVDAVEQAMDLGMDKVELTGDLNMDRNLTITDGFVLDGKTFTITLNENSITVNGGSVKSKVTGNNASATVNLSGNYTLKAGSVVIEDLNGTNPVTSANPDGDSVTVESGDKVQITGALNSKLTVYYNGGEVVLNNLNITSSGSLYFVVGTDGNSVAVDATNTVSVYGQIMASAASGNNAFRGLAIEVQSNTTFRSYGGSVIQDTITVKAVSATDKTIIINLDGAMHTLTINDDINSSNTYGQTQTVVIGSTLDIVSGTTVVIQGQFVVNEGVTLTIQDGAELIINGTTCVMDVNGNIIVDDGGKLTVIDSQAVDIAGSVQIYGTMDIDAGKVTIQENGNVTVAVDGLLDIAMGESTEIKAGATLDILGGFTIGAVTNEGTISLTGAVMNGVSNITLKNGGAVNVNSYSASGAFNLTVKDEGANQIAFTGAQYAGFSGTVITAEKTGTQEKPVYTLYVSGGIIGVDNSEEQTITTFGASVTGSGIAVTGDLTLGEGVTLTVNSGAEVAVSGTITATAKDSKIDNKGTIDVTGTITATTEIKTGVVNAAYYVTTVTTGTNAGTTYTYTTFENAVQSGATRVTVGVGTGSVVTVLADVTVPGTVTMVTVTGTMNIGDADNRDITVTVNDGARVTGKIVVYATLTFDNSRNDNAAVTSDVIINAEPARTYTNLYTALASGAETVTLAGPVILTSSIEVPAGTTLVVPAGTGVQFNAGVTMTVNGAVQTAMDFTTGTYKDSTGTEKQVAFTDKTASTTDGTAKIVVNGKFMSSVTGKTADVLYGEYKIPGAYYNISDATGAFIVVAPVATAAAENAADIVDGMIAVYGEVSMGDITFNGTESDVLSVVVYGKTTGNVTLSYTAFAVVDAKTSSTAQFTGTISSGIGSVKLVNVNYVIIADTFVEKDGTDVEYMYLYGTPAQADAKVDSSISVASGNVTVPAVTGEVALGIATVPAAGDVPAHNAVALDVASGATLTVNGQLNAYDITVDGTLVSIDGGIVKLTEAFIFGTLTVAENDTEAKINAGSAEIGTLYVGLDKKYDNMTAATVNGTVAVTDKMVVSAEATVSADMLEDFSASTAFSVEGSVWFTAYGDSASTDVVIKDVAVENADFLGWAEEEDGDLIYVDPNATDKVAQTAFGIGDYETLYAVIDYEIYSVSITADAGIGTVAIDGKVLQQIGGNVFEISGLKAGTHTIDYILNSGYEGTPVISVNGTVITGNTFTLSGTSDADVNVQISIYGTQPSTSGGEIVVNTGSDDMSLTDILLIVLVVLIVIMAVIVALRLMRS